MQPLESLGEHFRHDRGRAGNAGLSRLTTLHAGSHASSAIPFAHNTPQRIPTTHLVATCFLRSFL
jgi:hypothetical protein